MPLLAAATRAQGMSRAAGVPAQAHAPLAIHRVQPTADVPRM